MKVKKMKSHLLSNYKLENSSDKYESDEQPSIESDELTWDEELFKSEYYDSECPTVFTRPHITHFERKNSRSDFSILKVYEITPETILKHVFHKATHEKVYIYIIMLKVNA